MNKEKCPECKRLVGCKNKTLSTHRTGRSKPSFVKSRCTGSGLSLRKKK